MNPKTAQGWIDSYLYLDRLGAGVPLFLARLVTAGYTKAMREVKPYKPRIRLRRAEKKKTPQAIKKDLKKELEAHCKAVVFTRDCGSPEAREGVCVTCNQYRVLQWGHFVPQNHSKWLVYDPKNSAGQCAGCNGPGGRGKPFEFGLAIDKRDGVGSAAALHYEAQVHKWWRPNKVELAKKLAWLQATYPLPSAPSSAPLSQSSGEGSPSQSSTCNNEVTHE